MRLYRSAVSYCLFAIFLVAACFFASGLTKRSLQADQPKTGTFDPSLFRRLAEWEQKQGFSRDQPTGKFIKTFTKKDYKSKREIREFSFTPNVFVDIDPKDNRVLLLARLGRKEPTIQDHAATWSSTEAIRLAREAAGIVMGTMPERLAPPKATFTPARTINGRAHWRIFWNRASRDGYTWVMEGIGVELHEDRGLEAFYDSRWSDFTEPALGAQMREPAELEATARELGIAIQRQERDSSLLKLVGSELRVIEPNTYGWPSNVGGRPKIKQESIIARVFIFEEWRSGAARAGGHLIILVDPFNGTAFGVDSD